jgi:hypothetical protein
MSVILATQKEEIRRRIAVRSQPGQIVQETISVKTLHKRNRAGGMA